MSEMWGRPWLEKMFALNSLELNEKRQKVGRLVQLILIQETDDKKFPIICEISDKKNYMRAALSRTLVKKLERATNKSTVALQGANAMVVDFIPKLYDPLDESTGEIRLDVPRHVRNDRKMQFWMLITNLKYMGGDGNGTFDEPVFINTSIHIVKRMQAHLLLRGRSGYASDQESSMHAGQTVPDVSMAESDAEGDAAGFSGTDHVRKKQRIAHGLAQASTAQMSRPPVLGQVPFLSDVDAAWQSEALWESLAIQQACASFMPVCGPEEAGGHLQQGNDPKEASVGRRVSAAHECQEPSLAALGGVGQQGHKADPVPPRAESAVSGDRGCQGREAVEEAPVLGRLLRPETHSCVESLVMMERFYGPEESSPPMRDIDSPMAGLLNAGGRSLLDSADGYWDQTSSLVIHSNSMDEAE